MTTAAIIQARTGSTRLPGKVLMPLAGRPMLEHVIRRAAAEGVDAVCVATTRAGRDDPIVDLARRCGAEVHRGSEEDVLARYRDAAAELGADLVIRVTSDCPLFDRALLGEMLRARERLVEETGPVDYYANTLVRTYPRGLDAEITPREILERVAREATDPRAREHVTWQIYTHPEAFRLENHRQAGGRDDSHLRWTVDTSEDYELLCRIFDELGDGDFGRREVLMCLEQHRDWTQINAQVGQKPV